MNFEAGTQIVVFYMSCKKVSCFFLGLVLCFAGNLSFAVLMEQGNQELVSDPKITRLLIPLSDLKKKQIIVVLALPGIVRMSKC